MKIKERPPMYKSSLKVLVATLLISIVSFSPQKLQAQAEPPQKSNSIVDYMKKRFGSELSCVHVPSIEEAYLNYHIIFSQKTPELESRVIDQFLKNQDNLKIYFTLEDTQKIQGFMKGLFEKTKKVDCQFLTDTQNLLLKKVKDRLQFVKATLGKSYKLDKTVSFVYDPDKREWAKTDKELEAYLKEYIHMI